MSGQLMLDSDEAFQPALGGAGEWGTVGGFALREALSRGSLDGALDVLADLDAAGTANMLREAGFEVSEGAIERGRDAVLGQVERDLIEAASRRVDGFEVRLARLQGVQTQVTESFAAKEVAAGGFADFRGDREALAAVQRVLAAHQVEVDLFGTMIPAERASLQFVAGQAMDAGIQGFAFDGLAGKYRVDCGLQEILDLHGAAAAAIASETVREAVDVWRNGGTVGLLPESVPGSLQRVLQSAVCEEGAKVLVRAIDEGSLAEYARESGTHAVERTLAAQGLDVNAPTVTIQADELGLAVQGLERGRKYAGPVVGLDHCAALIKSSRDKAIVVPFSDMAGPARPGLGAMVRVAVSKDGDVQFTGPEQAAAISR